MEKGFKNRKRLFAGGPPANKNLFAGGPPANKKLFAGGPPAYKMLFAGVLPTSETLFSGALLIKLNSFKHKDYVDRFDDFWSRKSHRKDYSRRRLSCRSEPTCLWAEK